MVVEMQICAIPALRLTVSQAAPTKWVWFG